MFLSSKTQLARRSLVPWLVACAGLLSLLFTVIPLLDDEAPPRYPGEPVLLPAFGLARTVRHWLWRGSWVEGPGGFLVQTLLVVIPFVVLLVTYGLLLRAAARGGTVGLRMLLGLTVIASAPLVLSDFLLSRDVYSYIVYGRMPVLYGGNPYVNVPMDFADPFLGYVSYHWRFVQSAYGPLWSLLSMGLTWLAERLGGSLGAYLLVYKLTQVGAHLGNTVLIHRLARRLRPGQETFAAVAFAFNPLMLSETAWNAHNDALLLLCVLSAFTAYLSGRPRLGLLLLLVSIFVKWVTVVVVPLYLLLLLRQARSRREMAGWVGRAAALGLVVAALAFAPFWRGPDTLFSLRGQMFLKFMHNSLADMIHSEIRRAGYADESGLDPDLDVARAMAPVIANYKQTGKMDWSLAPPPVTPLLQDTLRYFANALLALTWLWWQRRVRDMESLLLATGWSLFVFVTVTSVWVWPWYIIWLLGVACLARSQRLFRATIILTFSAWFIYFCKAEYLGTLGDRYRGLLTFGPALLYLGFSVWAPLREAGADATEGVTSREATGAS